MCKKQQQPPKIIFKIFSMFSLSHSVNHTTYFHKQTPIEERPGEIDENRNKTCLKLVSRLQHPTHSRNWKLVQSKDNKKIIHLSSLMLLFNYTERRFESGAIPFSNYKDLNWKRIFVDLCREWASNNLFIILSSCKLYNKR